MCVYVYVCICVNVNVNVYVCMYICVASSQNSPLVGRNESGIIHDLSKSNFFNLNFSLFCLLISILINIVFYVSTAVICNKTYLNVIFLYTNFVQQRFL